jgi:hypothetical protein
MAAVDTALPPLEAAPVPPVAAAELVPLPVVACACRFNGVRAADKIALNTQAAARRVFMVNSPQERKLDGLYRLYRHPRRLENSKSRFSVIANHCFCAASRAA